MTFDEIIKATMNKCNIDDDDDQAIAVVKLGINEGIKEVAKEEKIILTSKIPIIMGKATLPENAVELLNVSPSLLNGDKIEGRTIFTSLDEKIIEVTYTYIPEELIKLTDTPEISSKYHSSLINYACFTYYQFKKKIELAESYLMSFNRAINTLKTEILVPTKIEEVYRI